MIIVEYFHKVNGVHVEKIHEKLKVELKRLGITAAAAARSLGLDDSQGLRDVLGGRKRITAELLADMIPLGIDVLYILTGQRSPSIPATDPAEQVLLDSYRRCGAQAKQNLIQTAALLSAGLGSSGATTVAHAPVSNAQNNVGKNAIQIGSVAGKARIKNR